MNTNENIVKEDMINKEQNKKVKSKRWHKIFAILLIVLSVMFLYVYFWTVGKFGKIPFAQVLFHLVVPMEGAESSLVLSYFLGVSWILALVLMLAYVPFIPDSKWWLKYKNRQRNRIEGNEELKVTRKVKRPRYGAKNESKIKEFMEKIPRGVRKFYTRHYVFLAVVSFIGVLLFDVIAFGIDDWLIDRFDSNTIFEDYYVDSKTANITFPEKKKNLIIILAESLENSFADKENGGVMDRNFIPSLTALAKENTHFSSRDNLQGATEVPGTSWTMASMVSHTSGIPLMIPIGNNSYGKYAEFLPGVTSMGEILEKEGYVNHLVLGSKSEFAGIDTYFKTHGNYEIFDYYTAIEREYVNEDYYEFWGVEDAKLFKYAKNELLEVSKQSQPFSMIINTIDLHTPGGYQCSECGNVYGDKYKNIMLCQDKQINDFVEWAKEQAFYEDTVIVIVGDHLSMAPRVEDDYVTDKTYERTMYHCIINSDVKATNTTNRVFSSMDMYPTIMAALGCKIEGDRLGIGTNLYSDTPTVMEVIGKDRFINEISKNSILYNEDILEVE